MAVADAVLSLELVIVSDDDGEALKDKEAPADSDAMLDAVEEPDA